MNKIVAFLIALALLPAPALAQFTLGNLYAIPAPVAPGFCLGSNGTKSAPVWVACGGGPVLGGNNTWTGINTFTNTTPLILGTSAVDHPNLIQLVPLAGQSGTNTTIGSDSTAVCVMGGDNGGALLISDNGNNGPFLLIDGTSGNMTICSALGIPNGLVAGATNLQKVWPWHPPTAPNCTIGAGGTTCTTAAFTPPAGGSNTSVVCTANVRGTSVSTGGPGEVRVSAPGATDTVTYTTGVIAGGAVITFNVTCL